jgi:hypothetical protein
MSGPTRVNKSGNLVVTQVPAALKTSLKLEASVRRMRPDELLRDIVVNFIREREMSDPLFRCNRL